MNNHQNVSTPESAASGLVDTVIGDWPLRSGRAIRVVRAVRMSVEGARTSAKVLHTRRDGGPAHEIGVPFWLVAHAVLALVEVVAPPSESSAVRDVRAVLERHGLLRPIPPSTGGR